MEKLREIAKKMRDMAPGVALTGAGVSAESGISTYRDKGGLWDTHPKGASSGILGVLAAYPEQAPQILKGFFDSLKTARPNAGHIALADMERLGILAAVITQNVDDLHNKAGSRTVFELHGNMFRLRCISCNQRQMPGMAEYFAFADKMVESLKTKGFEALLGELPACPACNSGVMRPDFVSFGEPVQQLEESFALASRSGFVLVCGTSGVVHPAASIPGYAKARGAYLVEINPKPSELTRQADDFVAAPTGEALPRLVELLKEMR
jgi:NAD-dependent deacetylase